MPPDLGLPETVRTLTGLLLWRVFDTPDRVAYRDATRTLTWASVAALGARYRKALHNEHLAPGDRVAICARNSIEWILFEQAALSLDLVIVPLFFNDRADNLAWCLEHSGTRLVLIEDGALWQAVAPLAPGVHRAVLLSASSEPRACPIADWLPAEGEPLALPHEDPGRLATIVYTSGTTGRPKGVMLSHDNILSNVRALLGALPEVRRQSHRLLSFLPLSHMLERTVGSYVPMAAPWEVMFGQGVQSLAEDLRRFQPTLIVSVPRVFERIDQRMSERVNASPVRRRLFQRTVAAGWRRFNRCASVTDRLLWPLLDRLVARTARAAFGGQLRFVFIGGAAMAPRLFETFTGLGLTFVHGYGLTETAPVICCNRLEDNAPLSVGRALPDVLVRLDAAGELEVRGPNVMLGYWRDPEATRAAFTGDGWLRTGDLARIEDGRIYLSGRRKEIIVMSNGEKVSPQDAEQAILGDPVFQQILLVGEGRPRLALLAVAAPAPEAELVRRANARLHDFPGYVRVRRVYRVDEPWTVENGLLTPTLKHRRQEIERRYADAIAALYEGSSASGP
ncbi:MAG: AMP-dependent synthetase/ligase [Acidiferrobacteraceae bacterium]